MNKEKESKIIIRDIITFLLVMISCLIFGAYMATQDDSKSQVGYIFIGGASFMLCFFSALCIYHFTKLSKNK